MIRLENVSKSYDKGETFVLENLNLEIEKGKFIVLIGESGCGKTTTMKMINKLIKPTEGEVYINGENIKDLDVHELRRNIGYVIQKVGLFPHMTVGKNIEVIPTLKKWTKEEKRARSYELLELVDLKPEDYYDRYPSELSGGQQQRVGVARALAVNPDIILMDEPFSALDPLTREQLQDELLKLQDELHKTIVFVTHDMDEALKLGDKIGVLKDGKLLQYDTPENILKNPADEYVENFVGKDRLWRSPELLLASDIMDKKFAKASINRSPASVIEIMKEKKISKIPIVDKIKSHCKMLGIVSKSELKKAKVNEIKMKEIMSKNYWAINESSNMVEVLAFMNENSTNTVYVTDEENNLKGVISDSNIVNLISEYAVDNFGGNE